MRRLVLLAFCAVFTLGVMSVASASNIFSNPIAPTTIEATVDRGDVVGWVRLNNNSSAEVTLSYRDNGSHTKKTTVYGAMSFECAKHIIAAGGAVLTGGCYIFSDIPKDETVKACAKFD